MARFPTLLLSLCLFAAICRSGELSRITEPQIRQEEATVLQAAKTLAETDPDAAIRTLREATGDTASPALDFSLAVFLTQQKQFAEAEAAYQTAVRKMPSFARAWEHLGHLHLEQETPLRAAEAFGQAIAHAGESATRLTWLGYSFLQAKRSVAAETAYRRAQLLAPDNADILTGLARVFLLREDFSTALPILQSLCQNDPTREEYWLLQANALLGQNKAKDAIALLESARRMRILSAQGHLTLGDLYLAMPLPKQAAGCYSTAIRDPKLPGDQVLHCAAAWLQTGDQERATKWLKEAQKRGLSHPEKGHLLAGRLAEHTKDLDKAAGEFAQALHLNPLCTDALLALGRIALTQKKHEEAILHLERATRTAANSPQAWLMLGQAHVMREDYSSAIHCLEKAVRLQPQDDLERYLEQIRRLARAHRSF